MVSVIVPVYNCMDSVERCVLSLTGQSYRELQILLIDDGCDDGSSEICDRLAERDTRITVLHRNNGGVSDARNAGLKQAKGEYITFVDADDYVEPEHIQDLLNLIQRYDCDVAVCSYVVEKESGRKESGRSLSRGFRQFFSGRKKAALYTQEQAVCELLVGGVIGGYCCNKLYRSTVLQGVEFDCGVKLLEDMAFNYRAFQKVRTMAFADNGSYHYVQHKKSATHMQFGQEHADMVDMVRKIHRELQGQKSRELQEAGKVRLSKSILWAMSIMAGYGPCDQAVIAEYREEFKTLAHDYLRSKYVPLSHRISAVLFCMDYKIFRYAIIFMRRLTRRG